MKELKDHVFQRKYYSNRIRIIVDFGLVNFAENNDTKFLFILERNINRLFE